MKSSRTRRRILGAALCVGTLIGSQAAHAQSALPRHITLVVPQVAGGSNDAFGRAVAALLPKVIASDVMVDNRPGANGNIGSAYVATSAPKDGSVWLVTVNSTQTINPILYSKPGFDPINDFEPVAGIATVKHLLLVSNDSKIGSMADLLAQARAQPGQYTYGSSGNGTFSHLLMAFMSRSQNVQLTHVPYKGVAPALTDLIGGRINYLISTTPAALPYIKSGHVRALAVTSLTRSDTMPEVPTANETVPGMVGELDVALYAPKGTPDTALKAMAGAMSSVLASPEMQAFAAAQGATPLRVTPEELLARTRADMARWTPIIKEAGMTID